MNVRTSSSMGSQIFKFLPDPSFRLLFEQCCMYVTRVLPDCFFRRHSQPFVLFCLVLFAELVAVIARELGDIELRFPPHQYK